MKNLYVIIIGWVGMVGCASTSGLSPNREIRVDAREAEIVEVDSVSPGDSKGLAATFVAPLKPVPVEAPSQETDEAPYLRTLCNRGDFDAVRVHRASFTEPLQDPPLIRCWIEALLDAGKVRQALEVAAPLLERSDEEGNRSRKLFGVHYERLGRWALIRNLYEGRDVESDPEGIRLLGIAYRKLGEFELLNDLLPSRRPSAEDPWRWLWWLREIESSVLPKPREIQSLLSALEQSADTSEGATLRPLLIQAHRRGEWFEAAQLCSQKMVQSENEVLALTMSRTSVSAALQGDIGLWEASLSCALTLAQLTASPEATCQEIHLEQMDWEILKRLGSHVERYPASGECGRENLKVRKWLERWLDVPSSGASS